MSMETMGAMMGLPSGRKRTRRGPRKSQKKSVPGTPKDHLKNVHAALEGDDHETARKHVFHLLRSLRKPTGKIATPDELEAVDSPSEGAQDMPSTAIPSGSPRPSPMAKMSPKGDTKSKLMLALRAARAKKIGG